jgi:hypothetical protein
MATVLYETNTAWPIYKSAVANMASSTGMRVQNLDSGLIGHAIECIVISNSECTERALSDFDVLL